MGIFVGNSEKKKRITEKDEKAIRMCYEDYCEEREVLDEEDIISFENFKDILLVGKWSNEINLLGND